ncbi:MAG: hypothetical protein R3B09_08165 [Nannocystaceae bacterium]
MEVRDSNYRVWYDEKAHTVFFEGTLRLTTAEYEPISNLLQQVLSTQPPALTLHMLELSFLNSSGINMLYKFAIALRKNGLQQVYVNGSSTIPWQSKSLSNLKKFLPVIEISMR